MKRYKTDSDKSSEPESNPFRLAAGLMWNDRVLLLALYPLLVLPVLVETIFEFTTPVLSGGVMILDRIFQLIVFYYIGTRWVRKLSPTSPGRSGNPFLYFVFGILVWALFVIPLTLLRTVELNGVRMLALFLIGPATYIAYQYYLYFLPLFSGARSLREALNEARAYVRTDPLLPLRIELPSLGIMFILTGLLTSPYPDNRELISSISTSFASGTAWIISCYLGLAYGFCEMPESTWRALSLDPYRKARITTLSIHAADWLHPLLTLKAGIISVLISIPLWGGNMIRLVQTPPSATIKILSSEVSGEEKTEESVVKLVLEVQDTAFNLRGFQIMNFSLGGEKGTPLAPPPVEATLLDERYSPGERDARLTFPRDSEPHKVALTFKAMRGAEAMRSLQDIHLWYRAAKVAKINLSEKK